MPKRTADGFWKRGSIWWTRLGGERVSTGCKDQEAAKLWRTAEERRRADPAFAAAQRATFGEAVKAFARGLTIANRAESTREYYEVKCACLMSFFGDETRLADFTTARVQEFVDTRLDVDEVSRRTVKQELVCLHSILAGARHRGEFDRDPKLLMPLHFDAPYVPRTRFMRREEVEKLLAVLSPRRAAWVCFAIAMGARFSEVNRAQRSDVNLVKGEVLVRGTKTFKSWRTVPILSTARPMIERAVRDGDGADDALFRVWHRSNVSRDLDLACRAAGIPRVSTNDLRRTFASWLVQDGVAPALVGFCLGHTSSAMVERVYGRTTPTAVGTLIEATLTASKMRSATT